jgi:hypothetical protein
MRELGRHESLKFMAEEMAKSMRELIGDYWEQHARELLSPLLDKMRDETRMAMLSVDYAALRTCPECKSHAEAANRLRAMRSSLQAMLNAMDDIEAKLPATPIQP